MFRKRLILHRQHISHLNFAIFGVIKKIATCAKNQNPPFSALLLWIAFSFHLIICSVFQVNNQVSLVSHFV